MPRYQLAIFDYDGTLADSLAWLISILNDLAETHHFRKVTPAEIETLRGLDSREILTQFGVSMWRLPLIAKDMRKRSAAADIPLFPDTPRLLSRVAEAGMTLAIVSSNAEATIRRALGPSAALVSHYACGASLFGKAAKFKAVLRAAGTPAQQAIAVGDETRDIDAAKACGIASAAVTWGYARRPALEAADPSLVFDSADALIAGIC